MRTFETLTDAQRATIERAQHELAKIPLIPCTRCNYCAKVCPNEIGISGTFTAMIMHTLYGDLETAKKERTWQVDRHGKRPADDCIKCGRCEQACPQHIKIRDELARSIELFGPAEKA